MVKVAEKINRIELFAEMENYSALQHEFVSALESSETLEDFQELTRGLEILVDYEAQFKNIFWGSSAERVANYILAKTREEDGENNPVAEARLAYLKTSALLKSPSRSEKLGDELSDMIPILFQAKDFTEKTEDFLSAIQIQACLCAANYRCEEICNVAHDYDLWNYM